MKKSIKIIPFDDIENAYIVISCGKVDDCGAVTNVSFFYGDDDGGAEWAPQYGPITVITPCEKDYKTEDEEAQEHWFYDYITGYGRWSQLAVDEERLCEKFKDGDYEGVFRVLKEWSKL
jgi:hypothetical protein